MDEPCLRDIATTAMSLVDRPRPRAKTVRDTLRRFTNVLVWLPRDELSSQRRREIGDLATGLVDGVLDGWTSMMGERSEENTSELQSLMRISYAVFCLKKKRTN